MRASRRRKQRRRCCAKTLVVIVERSTVTAVVSLLACGWSACVPPELVLELSTGGGGGLTCADTETVCGGECVDVSNDSAHCGDCERECVGDQRACVSGTCEPGCPNRTFFVATYGDDEADGCTPDTAKATLPAALERAKQLLARDHEIHVAEGLYAIHGVVWTDYPVSILGGYDETTWMRSAAYGYDTFDGENETILRLDNPEQGNLTQTLSIGIHEPGTLRVDGLTIEGPGFRDSIAVDVIAGEGAQLILSNNKIVGGGVTNQGFSIGLNAKVQGGTLTIENNRIFGGVGQDGSTSLTLDGNGHGVQTIRLNTIDGGSGGPSSGAFGSAGIHLTSNPGPLLTTVIADNLIGGGSGTSMSGQVASAGVWIEAGAPAGPVELIRNRIDGGVGTCVTSGCVTIGLRTDARELVHVTKNRIYGGGVLASGGETIGIRVEFGLGGLLENNLIYAGNSPGVDADAARTTAIELRGPTSGVTLRNNTLFSGPFLGAGTQRLLNFRAATEAAIVENNLLVGTAQASPEVGVTLGCGGVGGLEFASFRNNVFLTSQGITVFSPDCESNPIVAKEIGPLEQLIQDRVPSAMVSGNRRLGTCTAEPGCDTLIDCNGSGLGACLFAEFSASDHGLSSLMSEGWKLRPGLPCSVVEGGLDLSNALPVAEPSDAYGTFRTTPWSIGAQELDDPTCE